MTRSSEAWVDASHMAAALSLARRGLGQVWPNPAVGCVIVKDGRVVGRGWTQPGGRPHAETEALARAVLVAVDESGHLIAVVADPYDGALPRENASRQDRRPAEFFTPELRDIVHRLYRPDFEVFVYPVGGQDATPSGHGRDAGLYT